MSTLKYLKNLVLIFYQGLGYNGDVGYQTFLYANISEVRKVFMFLIEKLPKESAKSVIESVGKVI